jgi:hypothetical protein
MMAGSRNKLVLPLARGVEATFSESDWKKLGYASDTIDQIKDHPRLLRSLSWNDQDYGGHVLDFVSLALKKGGVECFRGFADLQKWLAKHEPAACQEVFGEGAKAADPHVTPRADLRHRVGRPPSWTPPAPPSAPVPLTVTLAPATLYDVAISFAGEDRTMAEALAEALTSAGVSVFYDKYEVASLWGKDLYQHLADIYTNRAHYCIIFVSAAYAQKLWTNHEFRSAQARAFMERREYILPIRIDDTRLPGVPDTVGYLDWSEHTPHDISAFVLMKLGRTP